MLMSEVGVTRPASVPYQKPDGAIRNSRPPQLELYAGNRQLDPRDTRSLQLHVLVVHRIVVDAAVGRSDPRRYLAGLGDALHQAHDVGSVAVAGQPIVLARAK